MAHIGSWGTPDFGITEWITDKFGQSRNKLGGSQLRAGTIFDKPGKEYIYDNIAPTSTSYKYTQLRGPGRPIIPVVDTSGGGGRGRTGGDGGRTGGPSRENFLQARLNGIRQRLQLMRGEGERLRGVAKGVRDEVVRNINTNYGQLQNTAMKKRDDSTAELNKAEGDVVSNYGDTQAQLVKASRGMKLKNRALARALGYSDSSFYENMQSGNNRILEGNIDKLLTERSGKIGDIKKGVADINNWFNGESLKIDEEATALQGQADREYQDNISKSLLAEQNYGIDSVDAAAEAEARYADRLSQINSYTQNKQSILDNVAKAAGTMLTNISSRPNINAALTGRLADNTDLAAAQNTNFGPILAPTGTLRSGSRYGRTLASKKNPWDEYIYGNALIA